MFQAYLITCLVNNRRYVGITSRLLKRRWNEHLYDSRTGNKGMAIGRAIAKHGPENFLIEPVCCARSWDDICAVEPVLISQWGTRKPDGYNVSEGGEGPFGIKRSPDSVERSAAKHRGKPCHPNTRAAATRTHLGIPKSATMRAKVSAARTGKSRSEATKEKIRMSWAAKRAAGMFKTIEPYAHARKAASAMIAKIPLPLSRHIAATYRP
jgi:group I intron endonuclease